MAAVTPTPKHDDAHAPHGCVVLLFFLKPNKFFDAA
jgi:hypothetical protein